MGLEEPDNEDRSVAQVMMKYHIAAGIFVPHQIASFHEEILCTVPAGHFHGVQPGTALTGVTIHLWPPGMEMHPQRHSTCSVTC